MHGEPWCKDYIRLLWPWFDLWPWSFGPFYKFDIWPLSFRKLYPEGLYSYPGERVDRCCLNGQLTLTWPLTFNTETLKRSNHGTSSVGYISHSFIMMFIYSERTNIEPDRGLTRPDCICLCFEDYWFRKTRLMINYIFKTAWCHFDLILPTTLILWSFCFKIGFMPLSYGEIDSGDWNSWVECGQMLWILWPWLDPWPLVHGPWKVKRRYLENKNLHF